MSRSKHVSKRQTSREKSPKISEEKLNIEPALAKALTAAPPGPPPISATLDNSEKEANIVPVNVIEPPPPPLKRYYGRKRGEYSSSDDSESDKPEEEIKASAVLAEAYDQESNDVDTA